MEYVALLRGINVGKEKRIEMRRLKTVFEFLGLADVSTYINSGNIIFKARGNQQDIRKNIALRLKKEFGFDIPTLVKTKKEMIKIVDTIPDSWQNDTAQRTDVAYLFPEIDSKKTIDELPIKKEFIEIRYVKGAIFWNVSRKNYNKSHLNKIISHKFYQFMTVRNINTARFLAGLGSKKNIIQN